MLIAYFPGAPVWYGLHPAVTIEHLGLIPQFLNLDDPRPAQEQFRDAYISSWVSSRKWFLIDENGILISKLGDPPLPPIAECRLRDEVIRLHDYAYVSIVQPDGSFDVSRMD